jgi:DNA-directed RNA polymerase specialized sigma24 family protein
MASTVIERQESDEQLAAGAALRERSGSAPPAAQAAFEHLYRRHAPLLLAFIAARVPAADRDDMHQEVWRRVWQKLPNHFDGRNTRAWLYEIARNALIDHNRLQEPVLNAGGPDWDEHAQAQAQAMEDPGHRDAIARTWERLQADTIATAEPRALDPSAPAGVVPARRLSRWRLLALSGPAAAAVVAVALLVPYLRPLPVGDANEPGAQDVALSRWGWNRPGALRQDVTARAYLDQLAEAAQDWFTKRPEDAASLAERIKQFRLGCSVLLRSPHRPLSLVDRTWLVERCSAWAAKLDILLAALEAGQDPSTVRAQVDETITKLIAALRERRRGAARLDGAKWWIEANPPAGHGRTEGSFTLRRGEAAGLSWAKAMG